MKCEPGINKSFLKICLAENMKQITTRYKEAWVMHFKLECCFWQDIILYLVEIFLLSSSRESPALKCIELLTIFPTYLEFPKNSCLLLQSQLKWSGIKLNEYQDISYCAFLYAMKLNEWVNLSVYITPYCSIVECPILHLHETQLFISWILTNTLSN